jgi:hypothetical protein
MIGTISPAGGESPMAMEPSAEAASSSLEPAPGGLPRSTMPVAAVQRKEVTPSDPVADIGGLAVEEKTGKIAQADHSLRPRPPEGFTAVFRR